MPSAADLRTQGWKYCQFRVVQSRKASESAAGHRTGFRTRGDRCGKLVHPDHIKRLGVAICHTHEPMHLEAIAGEEELRKVLREKYDPGPLPLED